MSRGALACGLVGRLLIQLSTEGTVFLINKLFSHFEDALEQGLDGTTRTASWTAEFWLDGAVLRITAVTGGTMPVNKWMD